MIFRDKYHEPEGAPIVRTMGQLGEIGQGIYNELESSVRNPEGDWDCLGGQRNDLDALWM